MQSSSEPERIQGPALEEEGLLDNEQEEIDLEEEVGKIQDLAQGFGGFVLPDTDHFPPRTVCARIAGKVAGVLYCSLPENCQTEVFLREARTQGLNDITFGQPESFKERRAAGPTSMTDSWRTSDTAKDAMRSLSRTLTENPESSKPR